LSAAANLRQHHNARIERRARDSQHSQGQTLTADSLATAVHDKGSSSEKRHAADDADAQERDLNRHINVMRSIMMEPQPFINKRLRG
jgi:hypothetical protein